MLCSVALCYLWAMSAWHQDMYLLSGNTNRTMLPKQCCRKPNVIGSAHLLCVWENLLKAEQLRQLCCIEYCNLTYYTADADASEPETSLTAQTDIFHSVFEAAACEPWGSCYTNRQICSMMLGKSDIM